MTTEQKLREALQTRFKLIDSSAPGVVKDTWTDTNWQIYGARNFVAKANSAIPPSQATSVESEYVRVPREPTDEWAEAFCAKVNWRPNGTKNEFVEGRIHTVTFRELAKDYIRAVIDAALEDGETKP